MISNDQIKEAVTILVHEAQPEKVILFGSYARGEATPDSDLDLLVVEREVRYPQAEMARLRRALSLLRIPVDVLVTDMAHLSSSWADFPGSYLYDALREGEVLYAVDRTGTPTTA
ncbi:nucleotidyltransferase domain-containing protein [Candidatus Poribacteria bacterium]|nr:nucleotidyltransferase domain-containing protein [Candidatus Poribacteria bacterium]